jgi:hypothetical protein
MAYGVWRMARGGHGLPKVSPGPAMIYPSTPSGWATPETAWQGKEGGLWPSSTPLTPDAVRLQS